MDVIMSLSMEIMGREVQIAAIKVAGPIMKVAGPVIAGQERKREFVLHIDVGGSDYDIHVEDPDNDENKLYETREMIVMAMRLGLSK